MNNKFFRYLRPQTFDTHRHQSVAKVNGGVGFLITDYDKAGDVYTVTASVALCSREAPFSREKARNVLQTRSVENNTFTFETVGLDAETLALAFVQALDAGLDTNPGNLYHQYFNRTLYADEVAQILQTIRSAETMQKMSREIIEALGIGKQYRDNA